MNKKLRMFSLISGILAIIGGILMIIGAIMEDAFPKPFWFVVAVCYFINMIAILLNYRYISKNKKKELEE
jgi:membrane protein implicated in regulation of membrane protease activity